VDNTPVEKIQKSSLRNTITTDHLIIGAGIAGLSLALKLAEFSKVLLITKSQLTENNTWYAQGGIAAVMNKNDSFEAHIKDTLEAGNNLCHEDIVRSVVEEGPKAIDELIHLGVPFCRLNTKRLENSFPYHLHKEGGHSHRRIIHVNDRSGQALIQTLIHHVQAHQNITLLTERLAIDLITSDKYAADFSQNTCYGAYILDKKNQHIQSFLAHHIFLCTGGHGRSYQFTSNPKIATGDGLAIGWRAGCKVANLEFMQFHPTCLYHPSIKTFLISEALRGEGAILKDLKGRSFMNNYHPQGSLAPRDVVARAIDNEIKKQGINHVYLDIRNKSQNFLKKRFPNIYTTLQKVNLNIHTDMIPVVPAAHYSCGGIIVDKWGQTRIRHLYALGEVACTGLHGANRLASNSLLEALVFSRRITKHVKESWCSKHLNSFDEIPPWQQSGEVSSENFALFNHTWDEIRRLMWNYVGIVRTNYRLKRAATRISTIIHELDEFYWESTLTEQLIQVRNLAHVAQLTIKCAMARKESRGIHYNLDYPYQEIRAKDTIIG